MGIGAARPADHSAAGGGHVTRRRAHATALAAAAVVAVGLVSGCGSAGPAAPPADARVQITGNDMLRFVPSELHLAVGTSRIELVDTGAYPHNLRIPAIGFTSPTVTGDPGGGSVNFAVTFSKPGTYRFYCTYHQSAGMVGTIVVAR